MLITLKAGTENERHDIIFTAKKFNLNNHSSPTTFRTIRKNHQSHSEFSHGNLGLQMPSYSIIQIKIVKNYDGSAYDEVSISIAKIALTIEM